MMESKNKEVAMSIKICLKCKRLYRSPHGNSKYCEGKDCKKITKSERQTKNYVIGDDAKKSIQQNHKIFTNLLGEKDSDEFELSPVIKMGFDQHGFFTNYLNKDTLMRYYRVHNFYFHITSDNPQKIQIWKA